MKENIVNELGRTVDTLGLLSTQIKALYDTVKLVKDEKEKKDLLYMCKQVQGSLGNHVDSVTNLVKVVKDEIPKE